VGDDAIGLLDLRDAVLDMAITPDRGYLECMRGLAREVTYAFDGTFHDPADAVPAPGPDPAAWPVRVDDPTGCARFTALRVTGLDPSRPSPLWMRIRLYRAGIRSVSLAVDVTNYVMLELGQPMHAYDAARLTGEVYARRALAGEQLVTLDHTRRQLDPDDVVVADDTGAIGLAGVMGGLDTEIADHSDDVLLEAACWDPASISRTVHRHKLPSEAAHRFERGVDPQVAAAGLSRAGELLGRYGGATVGALSVAGRAYEPATIRLPATLPARTIGLPVEEAAVVHDLQRVGCEVVAGEPLAVRPPSWRPDLTDPSDLVEEVARLEGYDRIPAVLPAAPPGRGLTARQRFRRSLGTSLAYAGYVEVRSFPFIGSADLDALGLDADDARRDALRLANPLSDEQPLLRTTLLPGLLGALRRNVGRGLVDVALYEDGLVYRPVAGAAREAPRPPVDRRPSAQELALAESVLPAQPERVAVVLCGDRDPRGWWGTGRAACWADAVEAMRQVAGTAGVTLDVRQDEHMPWHPGRCAKLRLDDRVVGHAGELHPRVVAGLGLPEHTCAAEMDLSVLPVDDVAPVPAPRVSGYPPALLDVALIVDEGTSVGEVETALRVGAGELLESLRLFDVYAGTQVGEQRKSLAYAL
ncbi:MAG: phenylalanine--tRNA ligase subunit beta, partial [Nocardioidaceae bacterium]